MLAKTLLALFAAVAVTAAPAEERDIDDRALEDRDIEARALCAGTLIDGPRPVLGGTLYTYYSSAGGGTNCAYITNNSGKKAAMSIKMADTTDPRSTVDKGSFSQYAGPVKLGGMAKHCMQVSVTFNGKSWASREDWHCDGGWVYKPPTQTPH